MYSVSWWSSISLILLDHISHIHLKMCNIKVAAKKKKKNYPKIFLKTKLNNDSMVKYISLVELKSNPNYLDPWPNSPLTQKIIFILIQCIQKRELTSLSRLMSEAKMDPRWLCQMGFSDDTMAKRYLHSLRVETASHLGECGECWVFGGFGFKR